MQSQKGLWVAVVAVAIIAILGFFLPAGGSQKASSPDGLTNYNKLGVSQLKVGSGCNDAFTYGGCQGTATNGIKYGSCTIWASAQTIAASTTQQIVCQSATDGTIASITGITADAVCNLTHASSTNTTSNGLGVFGVSASSTAGTLVGQLSNLTGATFTWSAAASSSSQWNYMCFDPA